MGFSIEAYRRRQVEVLKMTSGQGSGGIWKPPVGRTFVYICPLNEAVEELNEGLLSLDMSVHFQVGPQKNTCICLDPDNAALRNETVLQYLSERDEPIAEEDLGFDCPVCEAALMNNNVSRRFQSLFGVIPIGTLQGGKRAGLPELNRVPQIMPASMSIWRGIYSILEVEGDITDPNGATLVILTRTGQGLDTRYDVAVDTQTIRKPYKLPETQRVLLTKALKPKGDLDFYSLIANMTKPHAALTELLSSTKVHTIPAKAVKPRCYGLEFNTDDQDCLDCDFSDDCGAMFADAEPKPSKPKPKVAKSKAKRKPVKAVEPEEDDDIPDFEPPSQSSVETIDQFVEQVKLAKDTQTVQ